MPIQNVPDDMELRELNRQVYMRLIVPLDVWLDRLRLYNTKYWDNYFNDEDFASAQASLTSMPTVHRQSIFGVYGFHAHFGDMEMTLEMWYRVYVGELGAERVWRSSYLRSPILDLSPHQLARRYEPGIHLVKLDLAAYRFHPANRHTISTDRVYAMWDKIGATVAQLEPLSFYGVLLELFQKQSEDGLPWSNMIGAVTRRYPTGKPREILHLRWDVQAQKARFGSIEVFDLLKAGDAAPRVV